MVELDKYTLFFDEIRKLQLEEKNIQEKRQELKTLEFSDYCNELTILYEIEKSKLLNQHIIPFINSYSFLKDFSSLQIIGKTEFETYHSKFLKYIWNSTTEFGSIALLNFLKEIGVREDWFEFISQNTYYVKEEHQTGKHRKRDLNRKRIDLLFVDDKNKWLIIIENKINSRVTNDKKSGRSQLDIYRDISVREGKRKYDEYSKLYILLSHRDNNQSAKNGWKYADYHQVFKSLLPYSSKNPLVKDYLKTLFELLFYAEDLNYDYLNAPLNLSKLFYFRVISKFQ